MFLVNNLVFVFLVITIVIVLIQVVDFMANYDYIVQYIEKYGKWEFATSPVLDFIDMSVFDPNTRETELSSKWRCVHVSPSASINSGWIAVKKDKCQVDNLGPLYFQTFEECNLQLFSQPIINQDTIAAGTPLYNQLVNYVW